MKHSKIETKHAPAALGPYSQAVKVPSANGHLIFVSGQLPLDPASGQLVEGDIQTATRRVFDNIEAILTAAGSSLSAVIRVEVFLKDLNDFQKMNEEYKMRFSQTGADFPARQTIQVARLPMDALLEISCIAIGT